MKHRELFATFEVTNRGQEELTRIAVVDQLERRGAPLGEEWPRGLEIEMQMRADSLNDPKCKPGAFSRLARFWVVALLALAAAAAPAAAQETRRDRILDQVDVALLELEQAESGFYAFWAQILENLTSSWASLEGDTATSPDVRLVRGAFPFQEWGAEALTGCAPDGGGDWNVQTWVVTAASDVYDTDPDVDGQQIPEGTRRWVYAQEWDADADLILILYAVGGHNVGTTPWRSQARRNCIFDAGHTAPATYWTGGSDHLRDDVEDVALRGLGWLPDLRRGDGVFPSNYVFFQCGRRVHFDLLTVAFADNDMLEAASGCAQESSIGRVVVGPSAGGTGGRGGGAKGQGCGRLSVYWWVAVEDMRRNPGIQCTAGPVNVINTVCFNVTDCGRVHDFGRLNVRGMLSIAGPITGCPVDRALTKFQATNPDDTASVFLEAIESRGPCDWSPVTALWEGPHTVFHFDQSRLPVPFSSHGSAVPHEGPRFPTLVLTPPELEDQVHLSAGANWGLTCEGEWQYRPNGLDVVSFARIRSQSGRGSPWTSRGQYERELGPIATPEGTQCPDSNANGVPDAVEARWGHSDPGRLDSSGRPAWSGWLEGYTR